MHFIHQRDAIERIDEVTYRYSKARAVAGAVVTTALGVVCVATAWSGDFTPGYFLGPVLLLLLCIYSGMLSSRFRPTNWLVRQRSDGLSIQFRSYLNHHFPDDTPTIVFIPFREIAYARLNDTTVEIRDDRESRKVHRTRFVELGLRADSSELARLLAAERTRSAPRKRFLFGESSTRYVHSPVRWKPENFLEIEWGVVPGAKRFLDSLSGQVAIEEPLRSVIAAPDPDKSSALQKESYVVRLAETGQKIEAVQQARRLYGANLSEAKALVDRLMGQSARPSAEN